jgi:hypothetical protein
MGPWFDGRFNVAFEMLGANLGDRTDGARQHAGSGEWEAKGPTNVVLHRRFVPVASDAPRVKSHPGA